MLKTIDFNNNRYTYDDEVFPNENTKIGDLYLYVGDNKNIPKISVVWGISDDHITFETEYGCQFNSNRWCKLIKVEPIPEIPILKVGMTVYHVLYGEGEIVEILPEKERIVCTFDSTSQYNSRYYFRYNGVDIDNRAQVLSFQPITLPEFKFKLEPKRVYIKDKINTDNLSDAMKRCKLIEHAILLIESGKELCYINGNVGLVVMSVSCSNVFNSDIDISKVYYYE